jgi:hypothetical protein
MPIEWAIIFLGTIVACVYFSYQSGLKEGVVVATELTLAHLEQSKIIEFDKNGNIQPVKNSRGIL